MADTKNARNSLRKLQKIKTWQLIVLFVLSAFVSATFLRLNNVGLIARQNAVLAADEAGDSAVTTQRLYDLQQYVSAHMNTDMGKGLYLESSYNRDTKAVYDKATLDINPYGNIYKKAQDLCTSRFSSWSYAYLQCITDELAKYPASQELVSSVHLPSPENYRHVFISPVWSPDFAGWSVLLTLAIGLVIIAQLAALGVLRLILSRRYRSV